MFQSPSVTLWDQKMEENLNQNIPLKLQYLRDPMWSAAISLWCNEDSMNNIAIYWLFSKNILSCVLQLTSEQIFISTGNYLKSFLESQPVIKIYGYYYL